MIRAGTGDGDMVEERYSHPFRPVVFGDTRILILGTFPSLSSFENGFYYSHPRNQFWKILSDITSYPANNIDQKIWLLKESGAGLWDMIASCSRRDSSDGRLRNIVLNDIPLFLRELPSIRKLLFTGRKAQDLFEKNFADHKIDRSYLPSPSPAYAAMSLEEKKSIYKKHLVSICE
jgi:hypoxanthine-DNA glycosylase